MSSLQTGDLILFSGKGFVSTLIKIATLSRWTHCGIIIADDPDHPYPLIYESTHNSKLVGLDLGSRNIGVQIVRFRDRLAIYDGVVAIRHIQNPNYTHRQALRDYRALVKGAPFEKDNMQMLASSRFFKFLRKGKDLDGIFCSEHVAEIYQALGWMCSNTPSNWYSPRYFSKVIRLQNGVSLGKIEVIKKPARGRI